MQSDGSHNALSPVVHGDIVLSIKIIYNDHKIIFMVIVGHLTLKIFRNLWCPYVQLVKLTSIMLFTLCFC